MKKISAFAIAIAIVLPVFSQSYKTSWKNYEQSMSKDLPKTAMKYVSDIIARASREGNTGQLLKGSLTMLYLQQQVSEDSAKVALTNIDSIARAEKRPVEHALWLIVAADSHAKDYDIGRPEKGDKICSYIKEATKDLSIFKGRKADEFLPAITKGKSREYYNSDLLNIVSRTAVSVLGSAGTSSLTGDEIKQLQRDIMHRTIDYYRSANNGNAVILAVIDSLNNEEMPEWPTSKDIAQRPDIVAALNVAKEYPKAECGVESYIYASEKIRRGYFKIGYNTVAAHHEQDQKAYDCAKEGIEKYPKSQRTAVLRNMIKQLSQPTLNVNDGTNSYFPSQVTTFIISSDNPKNLLAYAYPVTGDVPQIINNREKLKDKKFSVKDRNIFYSRDTTLKEGKILTNYHESKKCKMPGKIGVYVIATSINGHEEISDNLIFVSNMRLMFFQMPGERERITVVDARSGHPLPGVTLKVYDHDHGMKLVTQYVTDANGNIVTATMKPNYFLIAEKGDDKYCGLLHKYASSPYTAKPQRSTTCRLYLDRKIYRPAQKVHVAGIVFTQFGDSVNTEYDKNVKLTLRDANGKVVDTVSTKSDEFGSISCEFTLPEVCRPGIFSLQTSIGGYESFRVEEYKRPTFEVTAKQEGNAYSINDTVSIKGRAVSYTGEGVADAKVSYSVREREMFHSYRTKGDDILRDSTTTDSQGYFTIRMVLPPSFRNTPYPEIPYIYALNFSATAPSGETQDGSVAIKMGSKSFSGKIIMDKNVLKGHAPEALIEVRDIAYNPVDTKVEVEACQGKTVMAKDSVRSNTSFRYTSLANLPAGKYNIKLAIPLNELEKNPNRSSSFTYNNLDVTVHDMQLTHPADTTDYCQLYVPGQEVLTPDSDVVIQLGTPLKDAIILYDVVANGKVIESRQIPMSDSLMYLRYRYKEEYGDGITVSAALMRNGWIFWRYYTLPKKTPDKELKMKWTVFRDRLTPGKKEEWRLKVTKKDGSPMPASVIAAMYDASLDKFAKNEWNCKINFNRDVREYHYSLRDGYIRCYNEIPLSKLEKETSLDFDKLYSAMYGYPMSTREEVKVLRRNKGGIMYKSAAKTDALVGKIAGLDGATEGVSANQVLMSKAATPTAFAASDNAETARLEEIKTRENFAETAFFYPSLRSDGQGSVEVVFTVPESLTKWKVMAMAHTKDMRYGVLDSTTVAKKDFMVQPNMPRFLRDDDEATITAAISNLTDKAVSGTAMMTMQDASTLRKIATVKAKFSIDANGQTVVTFPYSASQGGDTPLLICKIVADCGTFADGEQHYLPVLSNMIETVSSTPFTLKHSGIATINIDQNKSELSAEAKDKRLVVEYTANPTWTAVQALPKIDVPRFNDAISLAVAYYATSLELQISKLSPAISKAAARWATETTADTLLENALERNADLKNTLLTETPWALNADNINTSRRELAQAFNESKASAKARNLLERLTLQQNSDGGFSWFPRMRSNVYITERVATHLLRINELTGTNPADGLLKRAVNYLDSKVAEIIKKNKEYEKKTGVKLAGCNSMLEYLNILRMYDGKLSSTAKANKRYLLPRIAKSYVSMDMRDKSVAAIVLSDAGYDNEARTAMSSIIEHTVNDPEKGRYFDSFRAPSYYNSYKIPTQVAALEAVRKLKANDKALQYDMLTWLLQSKRTQDWSDRYSTADAVYALLSTSANDSTPASLNTAMPRSMTLNASNGKVMSNLLSSAKTADTEATGYLRSDVNLSTAKGTPKSVTIDKSDNSMSWGAIYYKALMPASSIDSDGSEITVSRKAFVVKGRDERELSANDLISVGDLVRIRYDIHSTRDADYVSLIDPRAACLEPVNQLSSYTFGNGIFYYYAVHDESEGFFIESMPKGDYTITCDFRCDRAGSYLAAPAKVQCLYAPEYSGHTKAMKLKAKK